RPFTNHEKIVKVEEYLQTEKLLGQGRPSESDRWEHIAEFFLEHTQATRALIAPNPDVTPAFPGLAVWFASPIEGLEDEYYLSRQLYLFEDYPGDDARPQYPIS